MEATRERYFRFSHSHWARSLVAIYHRHREAARRRRALREIRGLSRHTLKDIAIDHSEVMSVVYGKAADRKRSYDETADR